MSRMFTQRSNVKSSASTSTTTDAGRVHLVHVNAYTVCIQIVLVAFKSASKTCFDVSATSKCDQTWTVPKDSHSLHQVPLLRPHTCALTVPKHTLACTCTSPPAPLTLCLFPLPLVRVSFRIITSASPSFPDSCCSGYHRQDGQTDEPTEPDGTPCAGSGLGHL